MKTPFTEHEAVLLLDAYLSIVEGERSRQEAAEFCSGELRNMAKNKGIQIDDSYRSIVGIRGRLEAMKMCFQGELSSEPAPKSMINAVNYYRNDRKKYDELLREAQEMASSNNEHIRYPDSSQEKTIRHTYLKPEYPTLLGESKGEIAGIGNNAGEDTNYLKVDFSEIEDLSNTKPHELIYFGESNIVKTWKDAYANACRFLIDDYPEYFARFKEDSLSGIGKRWITNKDNADSMKLPVRISFDCYIETNRSATALMRNLKWILDECHIDYGNVVMSYSKKREAGFKTQRVGIQERPKYLQKEDKYMFEKWMREKEGMAESSSKALIRTLSQAKKIAVMHELPLEDLFSEDDAVAEKTAHELFNYADFVRRNMSSHGKLKAAVLKYKEYLSDTNSGYALGECWDGTCHNTVDSPSYINDGAYAYGDGEQDFVKEKADKLLKQVEVVVHEADLSGITDGEIANVLHTTRESIDDVIRSSSNIVPICDKFIHKDSFVSWNSGANQLETILDRLMKKNNGYVSDTQLYEYAKLEMRMFLNDNDMLDARKVYDLAEYLFGKENYNGKHYVFNLKSHIASDESEISSKIDIVRNFAREREGFFREEDLKNYLNSLGYSPNGLRQLMRVYSEPIFFLYDNGVFVTAECMDIDDAWRERVRNALDKLFADAGDHVILRDIHPSWFSLLPKLPGGRPWTILLLQSILKFYGSSVGARTIYALAGQSFDTIQAMLVSSNCEIQTFSDAVISVILENGIEQRKFAAEELRELLLRYDLIAGSELMNNMPKALPRDDRFRWDIDEKNVTIVI